MILLTATIAGFAAGWWWVFDLFANGRVHYAVGLALLAPLLLVAKRWLLATSCAIGAAMNATVVAPTLLCNAPPVPPDVPVLRISSLNVRVWEADPAAVADYLAERDDDLIFLYSASDRWSGYFAQAETPYHVVVSRQALTDLETILLSRDSTVETAVLWLDQGARHAAVEAVVDVGGTAIRVLGSHPMSPLTRERATQRDAHLRRLGEWAAAQVEPVVIVGDLNATPWSHAFRSMMHTGGLIDSACGRLYPSWPARLGPLGIPIDHAVHSRDLVTVQRSLGPSFGSQHRMVHVTIAPLR